MGNDMMDSLGSCVNSIKKEWNADASRAFADWFVKNKLPDYVDGFEYCKEIDADAMKTIIPVVSGGFLVKDLY